MSPRLLPRSLSYLERVFASTLPRLTRPQRNDTHLRSLCVMFSACKNGAGRKLYHTSYYSCRTTQRDASNVCTAFARKSQLPMQTCERQRSNNGNLAQCRACLNSITSNDKKIEPSGIITCGTFYLCPYTFLCIINLHPFSLHTVNKPDRP